MQRWVCFGAEQRKAKQRAAALSSADAFVGRRCKQKREKTILLSCARSLRARSLLARSLAFRCSLAKAFGGGGVAFAGVVVVVASAVVVCCTRRRAQCRAHTEFDLQRQRCERVRVRTLTLPSLLNGLCGTENNASKHSLARSQQTHSNKQ